MKTVSSISELKIGQPVLKQDFVKNPEKWVGFEWLFEGEKIVNVSEKWVVIKKTTKDTTSTGNTTSTHRLSPKNFFKDYYIAL